MSQKSNPDRILKQHIEPANLETCYKNLKNLNLYRFMWIDPMKERKNDKHQIGLMTDEVKTIFPNSVFDIPFKAGHTKTVQTLNMDQIHMMHFGTTQKLIQIIEEQQSTIQVLQQKVDALISSSAPSQPQQEEQELHSS
jgi:hypothetical protein